MNNASGYEQWKEELTPVLMIKVDEFELLGYGTVTTEEIWECVTERINRKKGAEPLLLHQFVNEILTLSVNDFMNRLRVSALKGPEWFQGDQPLKLDDFF